MPLRHLITRLVVVCTLAGCAHGIPLASSIPPAAGEMRTMYELRYTDVALGSGAAAEPEKCLYAHYTGWLVDGRKFDSSRDTTATGQPRTPLAFRQGARQVIAGWDSGFEGMRIGGRRRLFIPYQLAYGEKGRPPTIPPRALLVFDVELMDVTDAPPIAQGSTANLTRCKAWAERGT
ncbi:MAG: FKBP-type peptidyl-prolyl cis-trans isomerase [Gemmatimonadaceae bacterium]